MISLHCLFLHRERNTLVSPLLLIRTPVLSGWALPSWPHFTLITSLHALSPFTITLRVQASTCEFEGHNSVHNRYQATWNHCILHLPLLLSFNYLSNISVLILTPPIFLTLEHYFPPICLISFAQSTCQWRPEQLFSLEPVLTTWSLSIPFFQNIFCITWPIPSSEIHLSYFPIL
jgi:hypothetical protein